MCDCASMLVVCDWCFYVCSLVRVGGTTDSDCGAAVDICCVCGYGWCGVDGCGFG